MNGILLATDGGSGAEGATRVASLLARRLSVPLDVVAVYEPMPIADFGYGVAYLPNANEDEAIRESMLGSVKVQLERCGVQAVVPSMCTGGAIFEIPAVARRLGAQVIVAGLGAHDLVDRALGGETALRLAQTATTPVLAVPAGARAIPRRVVVAMDFSKTSRTAAQLVASWLRSGDELLLVNVVEDLHVAPQEFAAAQADSASKLAVLVANLDVAEGVSVDYTRLTGAPARTLLGCLRDSHADLVVLGSHGYGALKRMVIGSVASKMIRLAATAVLVVPLAAAPNEPVESEQERETVGAVTGASRPASTPNP